MTFTTRTILVVFIIAIIVGLIVLLYVVSGKAEEPLIFSPTQILGATWVEYKNEYLNPETSRTVDPLRGNITTSEGESYTMLRAVWMDDRQTFDASWDWTQGNLEHTTDHLFSWVYGELPNGTYGVLASMNGTTTASDGDEDIALALVFASVRWNDPAYLSAARAIIKDIWTYDVIEINGTPYLAADDLEKTSFAPYAVIDPSYLAPEDYRIFAAVDPADPWNELVASSYTLLGQAIEEPLDVSKSADLPPDWISINKTTGVIGPPPATMSTSGGVATTTEETTDFGFDALRVPFRLALDYTWFHDPRDIQLLSEMSFLKYTWESAHAIGETYAHDGTPTDPAQVVSMYGGTIGYFLYEDPKDGAVIYQDKLETLFNTNSNKWQSPLSYYDDNWAWFGIALYNNLLPNLAAGVTFPAQ